MCLLYPEYRGLCNLFYRCSVTLNRGKISKRGFDLKNKIVQFAASRGTFLEPLNNSERTNDIVYLTDR